MQSFRQLCLPAACALELEDGSCSTLTENFAQLSMFDLDLLNVKIHKRIIAKKIVLVKTLFEHHPSKSMRICNRYWPSLTPRERTANNCDFGPNYYLIMLLSDH